MFVPLGGGGESEQKQNCLVELKNCLQVKIVRGGLGVRDLNIFNRALLEK